MCFCPCIGEANGVNSPQVNKCMLHNSHQCEGVCETERGGGGGGVEGKGRHREAEGEINFYSFSRIDSVANMGVLFPGTDPQNLS